jgi:Uma2 family endonuclease
MRGFRGVTAAMIDLGRLSESAMNLRTAPAMDKATFRRWLEHQERRFELVEGRPRVLPHFAMTHARICGKLFTMLTARIDLDRFDITLADFAVGTGPASIRFPDVLVCPRLADGQAHETSDALVLIEVLSPSTAAEDFGPKRDEYLSLSVLRSYVIFAQDKPSAWLWQRRPDADWPNEPTLLDGTGAALELPELDAVLSLAEIYSGVGLGH